MALNKQTLTINFNLGIDTKTDPFQVEANKFLALRNTVFDTLGQLTKRNGFGYLAALPSSSTFFLTTFRDNLTALSTSSLQAYSADTATWLTKGTITPVALSTLPLIHSNLNQTQVDTAIAPNGLVCTVYTETGTAYNYAVSDSVTGQNVVAPTAIPPLTGTITGSPRVFLLGNYFIIVFTNVITATSHLQYIAISTNNPAIVTANVDIASSYIAASTLSWDGVVVGSKLFIAYNTTTGGQAVKVTYLSSTLGSPVTAVTFAAEIATIMSLCADTAIAGSPIIYCSYYDLAGTTGYTLAIDQNLNTILAPTQFIPSGTVLNLTSIATSGILSVFYEISNVVSALGSINSNYINKNTITQAGVVGTASVMARSVGLASKAFRYNSIIYMLTIQSSTLQPTYFLLSSTGTVISRLAYQNGGTYYTLGLPSVTVADTVAQIPYLLKDLVTTVNKGTAVAAGTQVSQVYSQTGLNLATFDFNPSNSVAEIGNNLHLSGGFLSAYDGYSLVEHNFFLYPEAVTAAWSATGGAIHAQPDGATNTNAYYYQATYEWSDNQGNIFKSAPSVPVAVTTTGNGVIGSIVVNVPTLRLTYKTASKVKLVLYRWSVAQQNYYQVTSITSPTLNSMTVDYIAITDTLADATILGNALIYTTGGVLENIAPPATNILNLFQNRLFMINAEDPDSLLYSKQVIQAVPVEMSDFLSIYVAPTTGVQGSTGPSRCLASMDDKQIIFKANAAYYINGVGPDITGANSQYSDAIYITSTVGCSNQKSLVLIPNGLMFESTGKGIWLLGRDLSTNFIGNPVEGLTNGAHVTSAASIPGTNQVRFALDSGITLVYDYYVDQWAVFTVSSVSSTIYNGLHTCVNSLGQVLQETEGRYLDGANPVLLSLETSWIKTAGIQGYQRFYELLLLGRYITPFKLNVQFAFDFANGPSQTVMVTPDNYTPGWGGEQLWGSGEAWGGTGNAFKARVFPNLQKCESFKIILNEVYDSSYGVQAGAGLTLSGLKIVAGVKKGYRTQGANRTFG